MSARPCKFLSSIIKLISPWVVTITNMGVALAQVPPTAAEIERFPPLHAATYSGDIEVIKRLVGNGQNLEQKDASGRTALHIAAFASQDDALEILAVSGADLNALEFQAYDIVTIAAVANDPQFLGLALSLGADAGNITSPYDGTALIAAAHLGHHEIVKLLIQAGAPLDHINNLGWTALMEAVILGNGGSNHVNTVRTLIEAGADKSITDREGVSPLEHAKRLNYWEIVDLLE